MSRTLRLAAVALVAICWLSAGGTAMAGNSGTAVPPDRANARADDIAGLIQRVAPPIEAITGSQHGVVASTDRRVPLQATPSSSVAPLSLALPSIAGSSSAIAGNGTVVHSGEDTDLAVQPIGTAAARVSTVLKSPAASHSFDYAFDLGVVAVVEETGGVSLRRAAPSGVEQVGVLQAPWAATPVAHR